MKKKSTISKIYNVLLLSASFGMLGFLIIVSGRKLGNIDHQLSNLSPYSTLADWVNIHAQSGLRLRIPKPIYVQVFKDILGGMEMAKYYVEDIVMDTDNYNQKMKEKDVPTGSNKTWTEIENSTPAQNKTENVNSSEGASLLYVVSFCSDLFGSEAGLSFCRTQMISKCSIDVLNWFDKNPSNETENIQNCVTKNFNKKEDFLKSFNKKIAQQELKAKKSRDGTQNGNGSKKKRVWTLGILAASLVLAIVLGFFGYKYIMKSIRENNLRMAFEDIDRNTKLLGPENNMESNEEYQEIVTFEISEDPNVAEDDWTQFLTVCFDFHHLVSELFEVYEENGELIITNDGDVEGCEEDEFITANVIEEDIEETFSWALIVEQLEAVTDSINSEFEETIQVNATRTTHHVYIEPLMIYEVHLSDRNESEFEPEEPPKELFLDMSVQENLLENARVGITTLHQCEVDLDNITEDTVLVTGFTVDKDDPLKFVYWKKRLRDVREELKADALEKLKSSCPTLFALGWFKENLPKDEQTKQKEMDDLKKENDEMASNAFKRERQIADDVFVAID